MACLGGERYGLGMTPLKFDFLVSESPLLGTGAAGESFQEERSSCSTGSSGMIEWQFVVLLMMMIALALVLVLGNPRGGGQLLRSGSISVVVLRYGGFSGYLFFRFG